MPKQIPVETKQRVARLVLDHLVLLSACCQTRRVTESSAGQFDGETAWATQAQMAELFRTSRRNIGLGL